MKTVAAVVFMLAACSASIPPPQKPVAPAPAKVVVAPPKEVKSELKLDVGAEAFAFQSGTLVMRLHADGRIDGLNQAGRRGTATVRADGTLSWEGTPIVRITPSGLVKLATNQSLAIHMPEVSGTKIVAADISFELLLDGTVVLERGGEVDRSVKLEGDPAARRTLFVVLVYTALWSKVEAAAASSTTST